MASGEQTSLLRSVGLIYSPPGEKAPPLLLQTRIPSPADCLLLPTVFLFIKVIIP